MAKTTATRKTRRRYRVVDRKAVLDAVPSNWCDSLLTGPDSVLPEGGTFDCADVEGLLRAVRARVARALNVQEGGPRG